MAATGQYAELSSIFVRIPIQRGYRERPRIDQLLQAMGCPRAKVSFRCTPGRMDFRGIYIGNADFLPVDVPMALREGRLTPEYRFGKGRLAVNG